MCRSSVKKHIKGTRNLTEGLNLVPIFSMVLKQDNNSQEPNCKEEEDDQGITKKLEELKVQEDADDWDDIYASD